MEKEKIFEFKGDAQRLDVFLAGQLDGYSRGIIQEMIKDGAVSVDGHARKPSFPLSAGNVVKITLAKPQVEPGRLESMIVFEDDYLLAVSKPSGLLVHPLGPSWEQVSQAAFTGQETLVSLLMANRPVFAKLDRAGLVHRLDRETSGIMLVAKKTKVQEALVRMFQEREVGKLYNCIACGEIKEDKGLIDVPIGRIAGGRIKASPLGRPALTEYTVVKRASGHTLLDLVPKTGRTNQLRVHMSWLGHPVLGDSVYGGSPAARLMLHSKKISFIHPVTKKKMKFESPLPEDFASCWDGILKSRG